MRRAVVDEHGEGEVAAKSGEPGVRALYERIGAASVAAAVHALGLTSTVIHGTANDELRELLRSTGARTAESALRALANNDRSVRWSYGALGRSFSTPREITALLSATPVASGIGG